jgi:hypothetical protein
MPFKHKRPGPTLGAVPLGSAYRWMSLGLWAIGLRAQAPSGPLVLVPIEIYNKTPYVAVRAEGVPRPLRFLLDPSAVATYLDQAAAARLGLATHQGALHLFLGGQAVPISELQISDFATDFPAAGRAFDGILGSDLFRAYVVEVDHEVGLLRLYDPATFRYYGAGQALPLALIDDKPYVRATVRVGGAHPVSRLYRLDFGTGDAINDDLFKRSPAARLHLGDLGRADLLIGDVRFTGVNGTAGGPLLGEELLHRFNITFDYAHRRLFLEPTRHLHDAFVFDMSGLSYALTPDLQNVVIATVAHGTPGEEAGLRAGDVITHIDSTTVAALGLDTVLRMFEEPHAYDLTIHRGTAVVHVTLRLRKLL